MHSHLLQIPVGSFPILWLILAVISFVLAIFLAVSGYKRYLGEKGLFLTEILVLWLVAIFKGKEESKREKERMELDQRRSKLLGISTIVGAIGCLLMAILFIIAALVMVRSSGSSDLPLPSRVATTPVLMKAIRTTNIPVFTPVPSKKETASKETKTFGYVIPTWKEVHFPDSCRFLGAPTDLSWAVLNCRNENGAIIAQITNLGEIKNVIPFDGKYGNLAGGRGLAGITADGKRLIVQDLNSFSTLSIPDMRFSSLPADVLGSFAINATGSNPWSPDGQKFLGFQDLSIEALSVYQINGSSINIIARNIKRGHHGGQYNWCRGSSEIIYVEGNYDEGMTIRVFDLINLKSSVIYQSPPGLALSGASCSPDNKWIAFREQSLNADENDVWLLDRSKNSLEKHHVPIHKGADLFYGWNDLLWSPNSQLFVLRGSTEDGKSQFIIFNVNSDKYTPYELSGGAISPIAWGMKGDALLILASDLPKGDTLQWVPVIKNP